MKNFIYRLRLKYGKKIRMENNYGEVMYVPACITLSDMVRLGFKGPRLVEPKSRPLKDGEWESEHKGKRVFWREVSPSDDNVSAQARGLSVSPEAGCWPWLVPSASIPLG